MTVKFFIKHINVYFVAKTLKCVSVHFVPNLFVSKHYNHTHVHFGQQFGFYKSIAFDTK